MGELYLIGEVNNDPHSAQALEYWVDQLDPDIVVTDLTQPVLEQMQFDKPSLVWVATMLKKKHPKHDATALEVSAVNAVVHMRNFYKWYASGRLVSGEDSSISTDERLKELNNEENDKVVEDLGVLIQSPLIRMDAAISISYKEPVLNVDDPEFMQIRNTLSAPIIRGYVAQHAKVMWVGDICRLRGDYEGTLPELLEDLNPIVRGLREFTDQSSQ